MLRWGLPWWRPWWWWLGLPLFFSTLAGAVGLPSDLRIYYWCARRGGGACDPLLATLPDVRALILGWDAWRGVNVVGMLIALAFLVWPRSIPSRRVKSHLTHDGVRWKLSASGEDVEGPFCLDHDTPLGCQGPHGSRRKLRAEDGDWVGRLSELFCQTCGRTYQLGTTAESTRFVGESRNEVAVRFLPGSETWPVAGTQELDTLDSGGDAGLQIEANIQVLRRQKSVVEGAVAGLWARRGLRDASTPGRSASRCGVDFSVHVVGANEVAVGSGERGAHHVTVRRVGDPRRRAGDEGGAAAA